MAISGGDVLAGLFTGMMERREEHIAAKEEDLKETRQLMKQLEVERVKRDQLNWEKQKGLFDSYDSLGEVGAIRAYGNTLIKTATGVDDLTKLDPNAVSKWWSKHGDEIGKMYKEQRGKYSEGKRPPFQITDTSNGENWRQIAVREEPMTRIGKTLFGLDWNGARATNEDKVAVSTIKEEQDIKATIEEKKREKAERVKKMKGLDFSMLKGEVEKYDSIVEKGGKFYGVNPSKGIVDEIPGVAVPEEQKIQTRLVQDQDAKKVMLVSYKTSEDGKLTVIDRRAMGDITEQGTRINAKAPDKNQMRSTSVQINSKLEVDDVFADKYNSLPKEMKAAFANDVASLANAMPPTIDYNVRLQDSISKLSEGIVEEERGITSFIPMMSTHIYTRPEEETLPVGLTEQRIEAAMTKYNTTREDVIAKYKKAKGL